MTTVFDTAIVGGAIQAGATEVVIDISDEAIALTPEERAEELAFDIGTAQSLLSNAAIARAALPFVSLDLIVRECISRGHLVCLHGLCRLSRDALPLGYPPWADEETLPFDAERESIK